MPKSIRSLLTTLRALEEQERSLQSALADEESGRRSLQSALASARNTLKGFEGRKDSAPYIAAQADCERLEPLIAPAEARIAEINRRLQEAHATKNEITAGADRVAVFALAYQDTAHQADRAKAEFEEAVRKHEDATARRDAAAARRVAAEQARAQADLDDADILLENLARLLEERRARLQTARVALETARRRAWKARRDDELKALHADCHRLHVAFAAGVASGEGGRDYGLFLREVMDASPRPADLDALSASLADALGVPARSPRFAR